MQKAGRLDDGKFCGFLFPALTSTPCRRWRKCFDNNRVENTRQTKFNFHLFFLIHQTQNKESFSFLHQSCFVIFSAAAQMIIAFKLFNSLNIFSVFFFCLSTPTRMNQLTHRRRIIASDIPFQCGSQRVIIILIILQVKCVVHNNNRSFSFLMSFGRDFIFMKFFLH